MVLLVEETGVHVENHKLVASHWQFLSHKVESSTTCHEWARTHNFSGAGTECRGSCNYLHFYYLHIFFLSNDIENISPFFSPLIMQIISQNPFLPSTIIYSNYVPDIFHPMHKPHIVGILCCHIQILIQMYFKSTWIVKTITTTSECKRNVTFWFSHTYCTNISIL